MQFRNLTLSPGQKIFKQSYTADQNAHVIVSVVTFAYTKKSGKSRQKLKYRIIMGGIWKHFCSKMFANTRNSQFLLTISYLLLSITYRLMEHLHLNNVKNTVCRLGVTFSQCFKVQLHKHFLQKQNWCKKSSPIPLLSRACCLWLFPSCFTLHFTASSLVLPQLFEYNDINQIS